MSNGSASDNERSRFQRVEHLFQAALDLPQERREGFLQTGEPDEAIRALVRGLLERHHAGDTTLRAAVADAASMPAQLGPYRVIRELGVGGMGTVLLAERMLGDTRQRVALKLIRGFPTAQARERLARERTLLAELNHPNIASLVDAGETADHVPYIAMEYVEGTPLLAFCEAHDYGTRERLSLFAQLCRAVQHAHQRLIVHRDIKPGNVLVREDGTAVLLDFGIGKLIDDTARDDTATRVFTPAYAAPEQLAGKAVTTATDIYGLGAVLHELLTGRFLVEVRIGDQVPLPSKAARDTSLARALRGDLDTLTAKAMQVEPERRYASAQALADDVDNYLQGRPLAAAPDSFVYRTRKFVSRHRFGAAATMLIVALIVAFVISLNAQRQRALQAEAHAEREAQSANRSREFLVSLFQEAAPENTLGHNITVRELIDKGSQRIETELKDEPESAARLSATVAEVYGSLGDPKASIERGEKALALAAGDSADHALMRAEILQVLGSAYDETERFDDAKRAVEQALELRLRYAPDDRLNIARAYSDIGNAAVRRGDHDAARTHFSRALQEFAKSPNADPAEKGNVLRGIADVDIEDGENAEAIARAREALDMIAALPPLAPDRIALWTTLARAQVADGDPASAVDVLNHALDVAHATIGQNGTKVSTIENDLAVALNALGRYREAIAHMEAAIAIDDKLRPGEHTATAYSVVNLGSIYENMGDYAKAETLMRKGVDAMEAETPDEPQLDFFRANLSRTLMFQGKLDESRRLLDKTLKHIAEKDGESSFGYGFQMFRLTRLELAAGHLDAAGRAALTAQRILDPLLPPQHPLRAQLLVIKAMMDLQRNDAASAQQHFEAAEAMQRALRDPDPISLAITRMRLAKALLARGDTAGAKRRLDESMPVLQNALIPDALELKEAQAVRADIERTAAR
jgi:serine/threonine-protein kinase